MRRAAGSTPKTPPPLSPGAQFSGPPGISREERRGALDGWLTDTARHPDLEAARDREALRAQPYRGIGAPSRSALSALIAASRGLKKILRQCVPRLFVPCALPAFLTLLRTRRGFKQYNSLQ